LVTFGLASNFNRHAIRSKFKKKAGNQAKRGPAKKEGPSIKENI
jgi:hypothetical protein